MRRLIVFLTLLWGCLTSMHISAQSEVLSNTFPVDSTLRISLLTCSPGHATYELYGHTAIRVQNPAQGYDVVFNYGVFDFHQPHFVWHFVLGECDYMVFPYGMDLFLSEYAERGSSVTEQVLNLLPSEAAALSDALWENSKEENRIYRYDIFRSNCTTKARDIIEANIQGRVIYPVRPKRNTFRTILHQFTTCHEWNREGNDLLLGADVDTFITERDEMFSPIYMMWYADSAFVERSYHRFDPLVLERKVLLAENPERLAASAAEQPSFPLSPFVVGWGLLFVGCLLGVWEVSRRRALWPVDLILLLFQGLAGVLIAFMVLFSLHPGVASNWQVWVLNPLPLFFVYHVVRAERRGESCIYHRLAAGALTSFLVLYFVLPQHFSMIMLPLVLLLLSRAVIHILIDRLRVEA